MLGYIYMPQYAVHNLFSIFYCQSIKFVIFLQGKRWINATGNCLITTLKQFYTQATVRCRMVKTTMMDHVSTCYLHNAANISFCDIFWDNRDALMGVYEAESFLQPTEIHRYVPVADPILIYTVNTIIYSQLTKLMRCLLFNRSFI